MDNVPTSRQPGHDGKSPSAVRRERETEMRRGQMVDAALRLFASKGYFGTTVEDISASAGFSRSAIYLHYPDGKAGLFVAALARAVKARHVAVSESLQGSEGQPIAERMRLLWTALWDFRAEHREYLKVLSLVGSDDLRAIIDEGKMAPITADAADTFRAIGDVFAADHLPPATAHQSLRYGWIICAYFLGLSQFVDALGRAANDEGPDNIAMTGLRIIVAGLRTQEAIVAPLGATL
jgi:AcrR family transcriptional regulator